MPINDPRELDNPYHGVPGGGPQPAAPGLHPVYTPVPSPYSPVPDTREGWADFLCRALERCIVPTQSIPIQDPSSGFRSRIETVETEAVIFGNAGLAFAAAVLAAAQATSIRPLGVGVGGPGQVLLSANRIQEGKAAVIRSFIPEVLTGDPAEVEWELTVSGGEVLVPASIIEDRSTSDWCDKDAFGIIQPNSVINVKARTASAVAPILVRAKLIFWTFTVERGNVDSLKGLVYKAGRNRERV